MFKNKFLLSTFSLALLINLSLIHPADGAPRQLTKQTVNFSSPVGIQTNSADTLLAATTTAGGTYDITFLSNTPAVCTIVAGNLHVVSFGSCSITASQSGDAIYASSYITKRFNISKVGQEINFSQPAAMSITTADQDLIASTNAVGIYPIEFSSNTKNICTVVENKLHPISSGICSITANQSGDAIYLPAKPILLRTEIRKVYNIVKISQRINFTQPTAMTVESSDQLLQAVTSAGSEYPITFTSNTPTICNIIDSNKVHVVSSGSCSITSSQPGNTTYFATNSTKRFEITKLSQTITLSSTHRMYVGMEDQPLNGFSSAGPAYELVFISNSNINCTIEGSKVHALRAGLCSISVFQIGDAIYQSTKLSYIPIQIDAQAIASTAYYNIGDIGPGGGKIYYYSSVAFTAEFSNCGINCHYLEYAPVEWAGGLADLSTTWSENIISSANASSTGIGGGSRNTRLIVEQDGAGNGTNNASIATQLYAASDSSSGQWYLPSILELRALFTYCESKTDNCGFIAESWYFSSSENFGQSEQDTQALGASYKQHSQIAIPKSWPSINIRPIRAL